MRAFYRDSRAVGNSLPCLSHELFQLYLYVVSIVCFIGPDPVFTVYSDDERPGKTIGAGYGVEESV